MSVKLNVVLSAFKASRRDLLVQFGRRAFDLERREVIWPIDVVSRNLGQKGFNLGDIHNLPLDQLPLRTTKKIRDLKKNVSLGRPYCQIGFEQAELDLAFNVLFERKLIFWTPELVNGHVDVPIEPVQFEVQEFLRVLVERLRKPSEISKDL